MSIKHAILSCLYREPLSGYDLSKKFDGTGKMYWSATHTQIYRTLPVLEADGMITCELVKQEQSPNKKVYYVTEKGKTELFSWLNSNIEIEQLRDGYQLQFSFQHYLNDQEVQDNMESRINNLENRISMLRCGDYYRDLKNAESERERLLKYLSLEYGVGLYEYELQWLKKGLKRFKDFVENSSANTKDESAAG